MKDQGKLSCEMCGCKADELSEIEFLYYCEYCATNLLGNLRIKAKDGEGAVEVGEEIIIPDVGRIPKFDF